MTRFLVIMSILFLGSMMFVDYQQNKKTAVIPEFTDEQIQFICNEEELN